MDKIIDWDRVMEKQHRELAEYSRFHDFIQEIDERAAINDIKLHFSTPLWQESEYVLKLLKLQMDRVFLGDPEWIERALRNNLNKLMGR